MPRTAVTWEFDRIFQPPVPPRIDPEPRMRRRRRHDII